MSTILVVSGTGTEIGKTVVTAAVAAAARDRRVAVLKPAQTGLAGADAAEVARLAGSHVTAVELARFPEPLAPATAARRAGLAPVRPFEVAEAARSSPPSTTWCWWRVRRAARAVRRRGLHPRGRGPRLLSAPVLVVAHAGLGTLNATALTAEALRNRGLGCRGVVIGSMPAEPDLASRCSIEDLPVAAGAPLLGAVPAGAGALPGADFAARAARWLAPELGGSWTPARG